MKSTKLQEIDNNKFFYPCLVILMNLTFFILTNLALNLRYETIDDFMISNILSKADGTYNFYCVHIHPVLSFIIMLLYKTEININWYTFTILSIQFISFLTIGIVFINKNKKIGIIAYILILTIMYSRILLIINYTSTAVVAILAGIIALMYYIDTKNYKYKILGIILIIIGTMLRWNSIIIVMPFYFMYSVYKKNKRVIELLIVIVFIALILYISNLIIYKENSVYNKYIEFNDIRTYFFDYNILNYEQNEKIFMKNGWSFTDWKMFYTYSFADEFFYTTESLSNLKQDINIDLNMNIKKMIDSFKILCISTIKEYLILFLGICAIIITAFVTKKNRTIILLYFFTYIAINFVLCYTKPMYRVIIPLYITTFIIMIYIMLSDIKFKKSIKMYLLISIIIVYGLINCSIIYKQNNFYNKQHYSVIKDVINYTSSNKENVYIYPNILGNISLAYSVYEKIPNDTFSNLRHMGDWDIYNQEYYLFKERYNIENPITDLYKKDNLYIISGNVYAANNRKYSNHIEILIKYIKEHYDKDIKYDIVKEFSNSVKIYKLIEE